MSDNILTFPRRPDTAGQVIRITAGVKAALDACREADARAAMQRERNAKPIDLGEVIALSDMLDEIAKSARILGLSSGRAGWQIVAQDAESLSERIVHLAAEITP
jgi:hypothetical protein